MIDASEVHYADYSYAGYINPIHTMRASVLVQLCGILVYTWYQELSIITPTSIYAKYNHVLYSGHSLVWYSSRTVQ